MVIVFVRVIIFETVAHVDAVIVFVIDIERVFVGEEEPDFVAPILFEPVNEVRITVPDCPGLLLGVFDTIELADEVPEEVCVFEKALLFVEDGESEEDFDEVEDSVFVPVQ